MPLALGVHLMGAFNAYERTQVLPTFFFCQRLYVRAELGSFCSTGRVGKDYPVFWSQNRKGQRSEGVHLCD